MREIDDRMFTTGRRGFLAVAAVCGLLASADAAEWEDPAVNSIGRLPPRTWSVPLARETDAFTDKLE